ncbi:MAG: hypothetical protein A3K19_03675 [Lentisphaerae bacterium RIFOXYB12_FULL_65_16]|nr:MAG: hypothetical protein A3K18_30035 [Lentisphaerae bacterium RIFOXYA12_64_32]OGV86611.1 MAG: hypothetical protein A3K19_03675 [Lentisphaerae bacterium RIFOXYB12_FULL_65_16]
MSLPGRIVIDPATCGGRPHFRGTRIPVYVALEMLANGETRQDVRQEFPDLTDQDLVSALEFARDVAAIPRQSPAAAVPA